MKILINRKMKRSVYKSGILLALIAVFISFSLGAQEVSKEYHKEFKADKSTTLDISNRYGDVVITAWDKDQVVIDVRVTVSHPDKVKAEKFLGMIDVQFSEGTNLITAKTVIEDNFNFSGWGSNREFKINYSVRMPYSTNLTLANRYGNTDIDELRGWVNLDIKYGGIEVDKLTRVNEKPYNKLVIAYSKGNITEAGWLDLNARYTSTLTIGKSQALLIDSRYSKLRIGETSSIVSDSKYDTYNIEKINNLVLMSGYTTVNIESLSKKLTNEGSYGSLTVNQIPAGFESLDVSVRYSSVRLAIAESANYRLEGKSSYGGIKYNEDNFNFQKKIIENTSSEISGVMGKESSPAATVKVSTSYGSIKLY
jgi:hypothetical protein